MRKTSMLPQYTHYTTNNNNNSDDDYDAVRLGCLT